MGPLESMPQVPLPPLSTPQRPNPCPLETTLVTLMLKLKDAPTWSKPQLFKSAIPERPMLNPRQMPNTTTIILLHMLPLMLDLDTPTFTLHTLDIPTLILPIPDIPMPSMPTIPALPTQKLLLRDIPTFLAPTLPTTTNTTKCTVVKSTEEQPQHKKKNY